jgi:uncharacterized integral membrane protein
MGIPNKTKWKLAIVGVFTVLLGIFLLLNREMIEVNLIIGTIEIRRWVMLMATFLFGLSAGWILHSFFLFRKKARE